METTHCEEEKHAACMPTRPRPLVWAFWGLAVGMVALILLFAYDMLYIDTKAGSWCWAVLFWPVDLVGEKWGWETVTNSHCLWRTLQLTGLCLYFAAWFILCLIGGHLWRRFRGPSSVVPGC